jgi:hypothetical protein
MIESDRRILTKAIGEPWHGYCDDVTRDGKYRMCKCGDAYIIRPENHVNRTFATAQDWEDLLEKVVRPNVMAFETFLFKSFFQKDSLSLIYMEWFLSLFIEERCELVAEFLIYMYERKAEEFEWVKEFMPKTKKENNHE